MCRAWLLRSGWRVITVESFENDRPSIIQQEQVPSAGKTRIPVRVV